MNLEEVMEIKEQNPWERIPNGKKAIPVSTDPKISRRFLWAIDEENNPTLLFEAKEDSTIIPKKNELPKLKGISINELSSQKRFLKISLLDRPQLEIFSELCCLLINASLKEESEQEALSVLIRRCWRWVNLLAGKKESKLSLMKQKGLIGELFFLNDLLLNELNLSVDFALDSWQGPIGGSKDFDLKHAQVEVKAKRSASKPKIKISSEDQLEINLGSNLYLAVFGIDYSDKNISKNLNEWCRYVEENISEKNPSFISLYNELLVEYGFDWGHDYSDSTWEIQEIKYFKVDGNFPKIMGSELQAGIDEVSYSLDINLIKEFEISRKDLIKELYG